MADRGFNTPKIEVDQDKYDELIKIKTLYLMKIKEENTEIEEKEEKEEKFSFGVAIELLKKGKKLQREGWNGKNQYIELATGISYRNSKDKIIDVFHNAIESKAIAFVGTSGVQLGWLASQADMLAEDWKIVKEEK